MRRRNADSPSSDVRLRAALRRFEQTGDPADAALFATEFLRTRGPPLPEPAGFAVGLIRAEYEGFVQDTAKMIVARLDVDEDDDTVSSDEVWTESLEAAGSTGWSRIVGNGRALETLLVSQNRFHGAEQGVVHLQIHRQINGPVEISEADLTRNPDGVIPQLASYAIFADLRDEIGRLLQERGLTER